MWMFDVVWETWKFRRSWPARCLKYKAQLLYRVFQCAIICTLSQVSDQRTSCFCGVLASLLCSLHGVLGQHVRSPVATAEVVNGAFNANFCIMFFFFVWELFKPNLKVSPSAIWAWERNSRDGIYHVVVTFDLEDCWEEAHVYFGVTVWYLWTKWH